MNIRRAALFCRSYLAFSETFIHDEVRHHTRWSVDVFCRQRENAERFSHPSVFMLSGIEAAVYRATTYAPSITRQLRVGGCALIHAHFGTNAVYAHLFARRLRLPLVITFHGYDVGMLTGAIPRQWWALRYRALAKTLLARADLILCASSELQQILADLSGRPDATRLYQLGIDLSHFRPTVPDHERPTVLMVGRFVEKKGHIDGILAFAEAIASGADARLVIVGTGPLEQQYRRWIRELRLENRVDLPGVLSPAQIAELMGRSDVLLAPSRTTAAGDRESGLIVAKEASACALPVIGTRHGGIPEIIEDGVTGYLVEEGDVTMLAQRLADLLARPDLRVRLGAAGRKKMETTYDIRTRVAELERLYDMIAI